MTTALRADALLTVGEGLSYLRQSYQVDEPEYDLVTRLINAVTVAIDKHLGRPVLAQERTDLLRGDGSHTLQLPMYPVLSITLLEVITSWDRQSRVELAPEADYFLDKAMGEIELDRYNGALSSFPRIPQGIKVTYSAGLVANTASIPDDIKLAAQMLLQFYWQKDIASFSTTFQDTGVMVRPEAFPSQVRKLLAPYMMPPSLGTV